MYASTSGVCLRSPEKRGKAVGVHRSVTSGSARQRESVTQHRHSNRHDSPYTTAQRPHVTKYSSFLYGVGDRFRFRQPPETCTLFTLLRMPLTYLAPHERFSAFLIFSLLFAPPPKSASFSSLRPSRNLCLVYPLTPAPYMTSLSRKLPLCLRNPPSTLHTLQPSSFPFLRLSRNLCLTYTLTPASYISCPS